MSLSYQVIPVGELQCNCVILFDEKSKECFIFDPGDEKEKILDIVKKLSLKINGIIHTHAHFDHVMASSQIVKEAKSDISVYLHTEDKKLWENQEMQSASFGLNSSLDTPKVTHWLKDNQELKLAENKIKVIHTPGHSPGSCCFYIERDENPLLISGDTVFFGSIGRTDLWGGDMEQIMKSIKTKILILPNETEIIPGHGPSTSIKNEKGHNPFFI
ncbi:MAG: MBL fold metallo-hydrolase [Spirochaetia bacterium]|nr:MBL fold metallo-hydrolase [Spirochaetia bacterium]